MMKLGADLVELRNLTELLRYSRKIYFYE